MALQYFKGDGSFIRNYYAIFKDGLDGEPPNTNAINRGYEAGNTLLGHVSYHGNSSFVKLITYLEKIQKKEERKEKEFISKKLDKMKETLPPEYYNKIARALSAQDYSSAYTLIRNCHKDLTELKEELSKEQFRSFQKTKSFWATDFSNYLSKELEKYIEFNGDKIIAKGEGVTIEKLVDDFLEKGLGGSNGIIAYGYEEVKDRYIKELKSVLAKRGVISENWDISKPIFSKKNRRKDWQGLSKTKKNKSGETRSIAKIGQELGRTVGLGLGMEVQAAVNAKKSGSTALMTGRFQREVKSLLGKEFGPVSQKGDLLTFEVFNGEYDIDSIVKSIFNNNPDIDLENFKKELTKIIPEVDIFETTENIKGYRSNFDLKVEQKGKFDQRLANLKGLVDDNDAFQKLVFILVNTTQGCLFDDRLDEVGNYVAAAFAAWMWDDYTEIYNLRETPGNIHKLHIFNSGGAYFTASTLMKAAIEELKSNYDENGLTRGRANSLFNVEINPGYFTSKEYRTIKGLYPVKDMDTVQEDLKQRWDYVRKAALERGSMSISIRQNELEKLLGNLRAIIKEN